MIDKNSEKPTEKQLEYANKLKIVLPVDVTKMDVSALISKHTDNDYNVNDEILQYAFEHGLVVSKYIGIKALYNLIFERVSLVDKIAFFIFSVYRQLTQDPAYNLNNHIHKELIYAFAKEILLQEKIVKSICNYRGSDLIQFGKIRYADNYEATGGSTNTYAYKIVADYISKTFNTTKIKIVKSEKNSGISIIDNKQKKGGCATVFVLMGFIIILVFNLVR